MITISTANSKLGQVHNISLPPVLSCPANVPCAQTCYARKAWRQYPAVRRAWQNNWNHWVFNPDNYFETIATRCANDQVDRFRWHVAGDIPNLRYYAGMRTVAEGNPAVQFMAFTKNDAVIPMLRPNNLALIYSAWPHPNHEKQYRELINKFETFGPIAWFIPAGYDPETPRNDYEEMLTDRTGERQPCTGQCDDCFQCWYLNAYHHVALEQH